MNPGGFITTQRPCTWIQAAHVASIWSDGRKWRCKYIITHWLCCCCVDDCVAVSQPAGENIIFGFGSRSEGGRHTSLLPVSIPSLSSLSTTAPHTLTKAQPLPFCLWGLVFISLFCYFFCIFCSFYYQLFQLWTVTRSWIRFTFILVNCVYEEESQCMQCCCYMAVSLLTAPYNLQFFLQYLHHRCNNTRKATILAKSQIINSQFDFCRAAVYFLFTSCLIMHVCKS